jgi:hypothetical protein
LTAKAPDASAVAAAAAAIGPHIRRTPTEKSEALSGLAGREVYLKLENLQKTGSFKIRGALNALMQMDERRRANGVVTASAGNHGQGVAFAAKLLGIPACVVLPIGVPLAKLTAIQRTGAETVLTGESYDEAHAAALEIARERKRSYVHAFDDDDVIAGQGTVPRTSTCSSCRSAAAVSSQGSRSLRQAVRPGRESSACRRLGHRHSPTRSNQESSSNTRSRRSPTGSRSRALRCGRSPS